MTANETVTLPGNRIGIVLDSSRLAIVDARHYPLVAPFNWYESNGAALTDKVVPEGFVNAGHVIPVFLHRVLLPGVEEISPADGKWLNCTMENLVTEPAWDDEDE